MLSLFIFKLLGIMFNYYINWYSICKYVFFFSFINSISISSSEGLTVHELSDIYSTLIESSWKDDFCREIQSSRRKTRTNECTKNVWCSHWNWSEWIGFVTLTLKFKWQELPEILRKCMGFWCIDSSAPIQNSA